MTARVQLLTAAQVVKFNEMICIEAGNEPQCYGIGKVESALHSALYPGAVPFAHGGIAKIADALAYYLVKAHAFFDGNKRTALVSSTTFMELNGLELVYPFDIAANTNALADILDDSAAGKITMDQLKAWYEGHKRQIEA
jgi:death-on-curing protein